MSDTNKAVIRRLVEEVWSKGNLNALDEIIHPDAHPPHGPWTSEPGPEGFKRLVSAFRASFPDLTRTIEDMVAEGDKVVLYYTLKGTHTGTGGIVPFHPTGRVLSASGVTAFRFVDGKIFEEPWAVNNAAEMIRRLRDARA
ncbi:MAG: ester cyclase [Chloroflexi bacterium]|nr:ester cyclase [Chloroflexota bacterium]